MGPETNMEQMVDRIAGLSRAEATEQLLGFKADFPMDFTRDYLDRLPLERLQHLLLAAHLYRSRKQRASA